MSKGEPSEPNKEGEGKEGRGALKKHFLHNTIAAFSGDYDMIQKA